jgi:hypothetical protein
MCDFFTVKQKEGEAMQLEFIISGQTLERKPSDKQIPVSNSRGYLKAHFALTAEFKGLVSAYFKIYKNGIPSGVPVPLDDNFICQIPDGVITEDMLYVSLSCTDGTLFIPTNDVLVNLSKSGIPTALLPEPDNTINEYDSFQTMYQEVKTEADKINLTDDVTSLNYKIGISNGTIFLEEVN